MIKKSFLTLLLTLLATNAFAEDLGLSQKNYFDDEIPIGPVALCSIENAPGLNWKDGKYQRVNYKLSNYIIQKVEHRELLESKVPSNTSCFYDLGDEQRKRAFKNDYVGIDFFTGKEPRILNRCYTIKAQGDLLAEKMLFAESCREELDKKTKQVTVRCGNQNSFAFQPSGEIVRYLTPRIDFFMTEYRDSIAVENGRCSRLF